MRRRVPAWVLSLLLLAMLTGCFQLQINGSVVGATITITRIDGVGGTIVIGPSEGEEFWIAALGDEAWREIAALVRMLFTGFVLIPEDIDILPDDYYLATASGGVDSDPMRTRDLSGPTVAVSGEWHAIVKGERLLSGNLKISIVTEAIYQVLKPDLSTLTNQQISQRLDELTAETVQNVDAVPEVNYDDALLWSYPVDEAKYRGDDSRLADMAELFTGGAYDEIEARSLAQALIENKDPVNTESATVCAGVVHAPPLDKPEFLSRIEIDTDLGANPPGPFVMTIPGANNGDPVSINVARDTGTFGINSYGNYKIGAVMLGAFDLTAAFASLATIEVTDKEGTVWCKTIQLAL